MIKSADAFRTISEVAEWLDTETHVLRFWESKFSQIKPVKRAGGRRYYRPKDMLIIGGIKKLLHEDGLTIKGTQRIIKDKGLNYVGVRDGAFKVKGDTYHYGESGSGTSLLDKGKTAAGSYLSTLAGDDGGPGYIPYAGGADTSLNPFGTRYDGTNVSHAGGGQFLSEEQKKYFSEQNLNTQGA